jgi:hypothetical protein
MSSSRDGELSAREVLRQQVEQVFLLTGGELMDDDPDEPAYWNMRFWYEGVPDYFYEGRPDGEYRTVVRNNLFLSEETPEGWELVCSFRSSGEAECPCTWDDEEPYGQCALCEGGGIIYIGDGWEEAVFWREQ